MFTIVPALLLFLMSISLTRAYFLKAKTKSAMLNLTQSSLILSYMLYSILMLQCLFVLPRMSILL